MAQGNDKVGRFDTGTEQLERRADIGRWQVVRANFTVADQDVILRHRLPTPDPEQVSYQALNATGPAVIYHDGTATRRPWGNGYVRLRSRVVPVTMDILLTVQAAAIGTIKLPSGAAVTPGTNADTLDGLDSTNFARSDASYVVLSPEAGLVNSEVLTAGAGISIGPGATIVNTDPGSSAAPTSLDDIPDVFASSPNDGDVLTWVDPPGRWESVAPTASTIVQVVNTMVSASTTGTTVIPLDDTIPQNTEGDQYMTLAITPTNVANKLRIDVVAQFSSSAAATTAIMALFQDATAGALAAINEYQGTANAVGMLSLTYYMTAGTISSTTFKVRIGPDSASTITFNGSGGTRQFGGVMASSITITEIIP